MLTPSRFYSHWKEKDVEPAAFDAVVAAVINTPVSPDVLGQISHDLCRCELPAPESRAVTEQDRGIYSLLRPERMLDLVRKGAYSLDEDDISLLFSCLDRLMAGLDMIRGGASDGTLDINSLVDNIHSRIKGEAKGTKKQAPSEGEGRFAFTDQEREWFLEAREQGMETYQLQATLDPACALKAARAYMVVSRVG